MFKVMILKIIILFSFFNLVLSETFSLICVENEETMKYESILNNCCDNQIHSYQIISKPHYTDQVILNNTVDCCVDYNQNYRYVSEESLNKLNCQTFVKTDLSLNKYCLKNSNYQNQSSTLINLFILHSIKTTIIRI